MPVGLIIPVLVIGLLAALAFFGFRLGTADWGKTDTPVGLLERAFGIVVGSGAIAMILAMFAFGSAVMD